jgi:non-ribosomal peptide synthetase component F
MLRAAHVGLTPSGALLAAFAEILTVWSKSPRFTLNLALFIAFLIPMRYTTVQVYQL